MYIPYQQLANKIGLKEDDILLIASDISKLAYTALKNKEIINTNLFVDSFKNKLNKGALLFTAFMSGFKTGDTFDKLNDSPDMGVLSKLSFQRSDFIRTLDPMHSFMVWGRGAEELVAIKSDSTFGPTSVFAYLKNKKAKMLLIDLDLEHGFTFSHFVEECMKVSYRHYVDIEYKYLNEDRVEVYEKLKFYTKNKGIVNTINKLEPILIKEKALLKFELNKSVFRLINLADAYEVICRDITGNKAQNLHSFVVKNYIRSTLKKMLGR